MMQLIDISWPISPTMTTYKNNNPVIINKIKEFERDGVRESTIACGMHTGTHIDAPAHFVRDGLTVDQIPLSATIGMCHVLDMTMVDEYISRDDLIPYTIEEGAIILFKTRNSMYEPTQPFNKDFIYLAQSAAEYLAERKIKAVGIDYLGIERNQSGHETHLLLLQSGVTIIEGLRLQTCMPGSYFLVCLPLAIAGTEAAPARAVLFVDR